MKASLAVFEAKDDEPLKQQNAQLQQQTIQQQEQLRELQLKLKKTREVSWKRKGLTMEEYSSFGCVVRYATGQDAERNQTEWHWGQLRRSYFFTQIWFDTPWRRERKTEGKWTPCKSPPWYWHLLLLFAETTSWNSIAVSSRTTTDDVGMVWYCPPYKKGTGWCQGIPQLLAWSTTQQTLKSSYTHTPYSPSPFPHFDYHFSLFIVSYIKIHLYVFMLKTLLLGSEAEDGCSQQTFRERFAVSGGQRE